MLQHGEALTTLMTLETKHMDAAAVNEIVLLAEELSLRPTVFSASGCFIMGFHIFYSVIGIVFSYVMIILPLAYNKNKTQ
ncbi:hypothetical protein J6590_007199 [Homalodisca vitripennis]|nr:hypothetical protein J6590_007199 [Homalodisca vitripennis]